MESMKDVAAVKARVYGNLAERKPRIRKIIDELRRNIRWRQDLPRIYKFVLDKLVLVIPASAAGNGPRTERTVEKNVMIIK